MFARYLVALSFCLLALPLSAQEGPREPKRVYVPLEELDALVARTGRGVMLNKAEFEELFAKAKANQPGAKHLPAGIVLTSADYQATVTKNQLLLTAQVKFRQFVPGWQSLPLPFSRASVEQATIGDQPAKIGQSQGLYLLHNQVGEHTLNLELSTPLTSDGSDQVAALGLVPAPAGTLTIQLPAGKHLQFNGLPLDRPAAMDQVANYTLPVGGKVDVSLKITDKQTQQASDSLIFATTSYGVNASAGEVTWTAQTTLQVFGTQMDRLVFTVPKTLEIADVTSTGLQAWELSDHPDGQHTNITLTYRQPFDGQRKIAFRGVMIAAAGTPWQVPGLTLQNVTSHVGRVSVYHPPGLRLLLEESRGVRRVAEEEKPAEATQPAAMVFDVWQQDFTLRFQTQTKQREVLANNILTRLDVSEQKLELATIATIQCLYAPLFELELELPAGWQVTEILVRDQRTNWTPVPGGDTQQLRVPLEPPLETGQSLQVTLTASRPRETKDAEQTIILPTWNFPQASVVQGSYAVLADADFEVVPQEISGLDPAFLKLDREQAGFQFDAGNFAGTLKITRKPSQFSARTLTVARLDPETLHVHAEALLEFEGGGTRTLLVTLPETAGAEVRFLLYDFYGARIVEQQAAAPAQGKRTWTLQLDRWLKNQVTLSVELELPRGDADQFAVPTLGFPQAARENGFIAIEASGEQRLTFETRSATGEPLPDVDPVDLPGSYAGYAPQERIVGAFQYRAAGATVTLAEQRFDKLAIPTVISRQQELTSILGRTGEIQHRSRLQFVAVGVQSLRLALPESAQLWATLIDGQPIEVRRTADAWLVQLPSVLNPETLRTLDLYYQTVTDPLTGFGTVVQTPPRVTVISGSGQEQPMSVLQQSWTVYYPDGTLLIDSDGQFEPRQPLDRGSLLGQLQQSFHGATSEELAVKSAWALVACFVVLIFTLAMRKFGKISLPVGLGCAGVVLLGFIGFAIVLYALAGKSAHETFSTSEPLAKSSRAEVKDKAAVKDMVEVKDKATVTDKETMYWESLHEVEPKPQSEMDMAPRSDESIPVPKPVTAAPEPTAPPMATPPYPNAPAPVVEELMPVPAPEAPAPPMEEPPVPQPPARPGEGGPGQVPPPVIQNGNQPPLPQPAAQPRGEGEELRESGQGVPATPGGLLSVSVDFQVPEGAEVKEFHYLGSDPQSGLQLAYEDQGDSLTLVLAVTLGVVVLFWFTARASGKTKGLLGVICFALPLALTPLAPDRLHVWLDGLFLGACAGLVLWAVMGLGARLKTEWEQTRSKWSRHFNAGLLFLAVLSGTQAELSAQPQPATKDQAPAPAPKPKPPTPLDGNVIVVPYETGTDPLQAERVYLPYEQFLQLWQRANPDKALDVSPPQPGVVSGALYSAKLAGEQDKRVTITARLVLFSFVNEQIPLTLPLGNVALKSATLDGKAAAVTPLEGKEPGYQVLVQGKGNHVLDLTFELPVKQAGQAGEFTLPLQPVPTGKLSFELPDPKFQVRVNQSSNVFHQRTEGEKEIVEIPVQAGGNVTVAWRPEQVREVDNSLIHAESTQTVAFDDTGLTLHADFVFRVRQGNLNELVFTLPDGLKLRQLSGPDVGGWKLEEQNNQRQLRVFLRRTITDATNLSFELYQQLTVEEKPLTVPFPHFVPQGLTRETGTIGVVAAPQFALRVPRFSGLTQINTGEFQCPKPLPGSMVAAYRYSARGFELPLEISRRSAESVASAEYKVVTQRRKMSLAALFKLTLKGTPRSRLAVQLPEDFILLDVQADYLSDWYTADEVLILELDAPRLGDVSISLRGTRPREPDDNFLELQVPYPLELNQLQAQAGLWFDQSFIASLLEAEGWKPLDPRQLPEQSKVYEERNADFAFRYQSDKGPGPILFEWTVAQPKLSSQTISLTTVTDTFVTHWLGLKFDIKQAAADTFIFTTPDWLAGKLQFESQNLRQVARSDAGNNRTRWTITLQNPQRGNLFLLAHATLPPAAGNQIAAPLVVTEQVKPPGENAIPGAAPVFETLELQRQYVILANQARSQLVLQNPEQVESIPPRELPFVVNQELQDQAAAMLRLKNRNAAPTWEIQSFTQTKQVAASVKSANLTTVMAHDGTWRAEARYEIRNRARQFLALKMPADSTVLSIYVKDQPSRAVLTQRNEQTWHLIALPKTSAADRPFVVSVVFRGRLPEGVLPKDFRVRGAEVEIPAPQVVSLDEDEEFGMPVAQTNWTLYLPEDLNVEPVEDSRRTNLTYTSGADELFNRQMSELQTAEDLFNVLESDASGRTKYRAWNNLKEIERYTSQPLPGSYRINPKEITEEQTRLEKLESEKARFRQRLQDNQGRLRIDAENQTVIIPDTTESLQQLEAGEQREWLEEQRKEFFLGNSLPVQDRSKVPEERDQEKNGLKYEFQLNPGKPISQPPGESKPGTSTLPEGQPQGNFSRRTRQTQGDLEGLNQQLEQKQLDQLQKLQEQQQLNQQPQGQVPQQQFFDNTHGFNQQPAPQQGGFGNQSFNLPQPGRPPQRWGDHLQPQGNPADPFAMPGMLPPAQQGGFGMQDFNPPLGMQPPGQGQQGGQHPQDMDALPGQEVVDGQPAAPAWTEHGGLSLRIELPTEGQKLTFTKISGDPRLTVKVLPKKAVETGFSLLWTVIWAVIIVVAVGTLLRTGSTAVLRRHAAKAGIALGLVAFFLLPDAGMVLGFLLFLFSLTIAAWQWSRTRSAGTEGV